MSENIFQFSLILSQFSRIFDMNEQETLFENLVTKRQLTEILGLSPSYISKLMAEEGLPYFKVGRAVRFRGSDVTAWLQKRRRP